MDFAAQLAAADRAALAVLGGVVVRYVPSVVNGDAVNATGIFDNAAADASVLHGQEVISSGPQVFLRLEDLSTDPELEPKDYPQVIIGGTTYATRDVKKDGMGGVLLLLRELSS